MGSATSCILAQKLGSLFCCTAGLGGGGCGRHRRCSFQPNSSKPGVCGCFSTAAAGYNICRHSGLLGFAAVVSSCRTHTRVLHSLRLLLPRQSESSSQSACLTEPQPSVHRWQVGSAGRTLLHRVLAELSASGHCCCILMVACCEKSAAAATAATAAVAVHCRRRHFGRKNLGYLYAIAHGAQQIFDFDDDNVLQPGMVPRVPSREVYSVQVSRACAAFNPYPHMGAPAGANTALPPCTKQGAGIGTQHQL